MSAVTIQNAAVQCPVCETENPGHETWCHECGFRLDAVPGEGAPPPGGTAATRLIDARGVAHPLRAGANSVGREDTDVLIADPGVSRRHAVIGVEPGGVWIEDAGSSNGTFVNDSRLPPETRRSLRDGDQVRFGSVVVTLHHAGDGEPGAEPTGDDGIAAEGAVPDGLRAETADAADAVVALDDGRAVPVREGVTRIGRRDENDLVIADAFTSGRHAEIVREGVIVTLMDVGSTNGTFLNGARLVPDERAPVRHGDRITFGRVEGTFRRPEISGDPARDPADEALPDAGAAEPEG